MRFGQLIVLPIPTGTVGIPFTGHPPDTGLTGRSPSDAYNSGPGGPTQNRFAGKALRQRRNGEGTLSSKRDSRFRCNLAVIASRKHALFKASITKHWR